MKQPNRKYLSWQEVSSLVETLASIIKNSPSPLPKFIYGEPRGGLIPAVMLSHALNIPLTFTPSVDDTLIVDDIVDSGATLRKRDLFYFACLIYKPDTCLGIPTYFAHNHTSGEWIVFPWEREDSLAIPDRDL